MRCSCCRPSSGPFIPTLDEVQEAASRLPNPTMHGYRRRGLSDVYRVEVMRHNKLPVSAGCPGICACCDTIYALDFQLRSDVDEYGSRFVRWMYSGGVRV